MSEHKTPAEHWEELYGDIDQGRRWSGNVNHSVAAVVSELGPGNGRTALDLGCGEGGDVIWLASRGWRATGVDISSNAVRRAQEAARAAEASAAEDASAAGEAGAAGSARFLVTDLSSWRDVGTVYDLVTASFFHSRVELARTEILRHAASLVAPGGHLLIVSHAAVPPWATNDADADADSASASASDTDSDTDTDTDAESLGHGHRNGHGHGGAGHRGSGDHEDHRFLTPEEEVAELRLDPGEWTVRTAEVVQRETTGPEGTPAVLDDVVVLLERR